MAIERQGWGKIKEGLGSPIRKLLATREGKASLVRMASGEALEVHSVGGGRDFGDMWEHIIANGAPPHRRPIRLFHLSEVESVVDPVTGELLISQVPSPGET